MLIRRLLEHFGSASAILDAPARALAEVDGVGPVRAGRLHEALRRALGQRIADRERESMCRAGASMLRLGDDDYPALLATICDPPVALWTRGTLVERDRMAVAIVGARRCGAYGLAHAARIAGALAERGWTIVSGGARGIDAEAHRAALRVGGRTVAVFGCGLGRCYPPEHCELFERIAAEGALLSEMPCATPPRAELFPRRNRIVSGLSLGVVVIEAATRSGALITARLAAEEHHREVMALPGSVDSPRSAGCHRAIREGWAALVTSADEVVDQLEGARTLLAAVSARSPLASTVQATKDTKPIRSAPTDDEISAMSTEEAIIALADRHAHGNLAACPVALLADTLNRPVQEIMATVTRLQLHPRNRHPPGI